MFSVIRRRGNTTSTASTGSGYQKVSPKGRGRSSTWFSSIFPKVSRLTPSHLAERKFFHNPSQQEIEYLDDTIALHSLDCIPTPEKINGGDLSNQPINAPSNEQEQIHASYQKPESEESADFHSKTRAGNILNKLSFAWRTEMTGLRNSLVLAWRKIGPKSAERKQRDDEERFCNRLNSDDTEQERPSLYKVFISSVRGLEKMLGSIGKLI